eukprot:GSMAST32.ASY1.ANO1.2719.1 assembled CDS
MRPQARSEAALAPLLTGVNLPRRRSSVHKVDAVENHKNALSTFNGCYVPCCLNILGIILFQRLSWAVGQAGVLGTISIFALAETMAILTVFSFSAIVTNGHMKGGGSYFMISRSLGPEFGGAIGTLFYLAYAIGVAFYVSGFSLAVFKTLTDGSGYENSSSPEIIIGSVGLFFVFSISYIGAGVFARFNTVFFVIQMGTILIGACCVAFGGQRELQNVPLPHCVNASIHQTGSEWYHAHEDCLLYEKKYNYTLPTNVTGFKWENLVDNMMPDYDYVHDQGACENQVCVIFFQIRNCFRTKF